MVDCQLGLVDNVHFYFTMIQVFVFSRNCVTKLFTVFIFAFQPVFKTETYEEDMEIAEVKQGFVHQQVICIHFLLKMTRTN